MQVTAVCIKMQHYLLSKWKDSTGICEGAFTVSRQIFFENLETVSQRRDVARKGLLKKYI